MSITNDELKNILRRVIKGRDYRIVVVDKINKDFVQYSMGYFKKVLDAKYENLNIDIDWYKKEFLNDTIPSEELLTNAGIGKKTVTNMYNSAARNFVIEATNISYQSLYNIINELANQEDNVEIELTIRINQISVHLNISESLIVINSLAVRRATISGGLWSEAGKKSEKYLMMALCKLFEVPSERYQQEQNPISFREVDFYLLGSEGRKLRCEVKLMGKGNPESGDAIFARETDIFVGDKLSAKNKRQADEWNVFWVEMRSQENLSRFKAALDFFQIPNTSPLGNIDAKLDSILNEIVG